MEDVKNIMVIGPTAAGKSHLLNLLLGVDPQDDEKIIFQVSQGNMSCTKQGQLQEGSLYNQNQVQIKLLDLPGLYDTQDGLAQHNEKPKSIEHLEKMEEDVKKYFNYKIHRLLYCLDAQRPWDKDQLNLIRIIEKFMSDRQKVIIVITKINTLLTKQKQKKIEEWKKTLYTQNYESVYFFGADLNEVDQKFEEDLKKSIPIDIKMWNNLSKADQKEICGYFDYAPKNSCQLI